MTTTAATPGSPPETDAQEVLDRGPSRSLLARRDAPGLVRFSLQLLVFAGAATATVWLARAGSEAAWPAVVVAGLALVTFFPSLHEAGHGTAFRTAWLNEAVVWISALLMLQAPRFFREFHWEHHRWTQDRERDPEIDRAPALLDDWPRSPLAYLLVVCGQPLLLGKLGFTAACALLPPAVWGPLFPFVPVRARSAVAWQSRAALAVLGSFVGFGLAGMEGFALLLVAWPIAHLALGFYLMPEHTGLPHDGSQLHRTRSVESGPVVRWLMWNMPLHAVHHAEPGVPFHAVPALHRALGPRLEHVATGYLSFHREALRRAFRRG